MVCNKPAERNAYVLLCAMIAFGVAATAYRFYETDRMSLILAESALGVVAWIVTDLYSIDPQRDCNPFAAIVAWSVMRLVHLNPPRDDSARLFCWMIEGATLVLVASYSIYSGTKLSKRIMAEAAHDMGYTLKIK
jgi:hypothetical protein